LVLERGAGFCSNRLSPPRTSSSVHGTGSSHSNSRRPTFGQGPPMLTRSLLIRIAGPTVLVSLLFIGSCITAAIYLPHQQSASVQVLDEAIASRRIAGDLLKALDDLASLPMDRRDEAGALHGKILSLLS